MTESTDLSPSDQIERLATLLDEIEEALPNYTNDALVNLFGDAKPLENKLKKLNGAAREQLLERRSEATGADDKGYLYFATKKNGVKIETRVKVKLVEDTLERLTQAGLAPRLPRSFDADAAKEVLEELGVDPARYTKPDVSTKAVEAILEQGLTPEEQDAVAGCIAGESVSYVVKPVKPATLQKALASG